MVGAQEMEMGKEKELVELYEVARKTADAALGDVCSEEESRCLDALLELKKFPVNYKLLVKTQVGKRLRTLTKHPRKNIQAFASELIEIWKKIIIDETAGKKGNGQSNNNNNNNTKPTGVKREAETVKSSETSMKSEKCDEDSPPGPAKVIKSEKCDENLSPRPAKMIKSENDNSSFKSDSSTRPHPEAAAAAVKVEKIHKQENQQKSFNNGTDRSTGQLPKFTSMLSSNDDVRDKVREILHEALLKVSGEVDETLRGEVEGCDPIRVAVSVESAMFEKWGRSNGALKSKYRSIMFNMKDSKNQDFRRKVLLGQITPDRIPTLSPEEMASDHRKMENQQIKEKALFECERASAPKATTDQFKCGRCGQRKCTYYQMQTRSADEPMTTFVTCTVCQKHWKFC